MPNKTGHTIGQNIAQSLIRIRRVPATKGTGLATTKKGAAR